MRALLAIGLLGLGGCHLAFPHTPGDSGTPPDHAACEARMDVSAPDRVSVDDSQPDAPKVDSGKPDILKKLDLEKEDTSKPDLSKPDLKLDTPKPCIEPTTIYTGVPCSKQCTGATPDTDCDGIPDTRDPSKSTCNTLLSFEHFSDYSPSTKWTPSGQVGWTCGSANVGVGGGLTLDGGEVAKITSSKFLVEAKYTLGTKPSGDWAVRLVVEDPDVAGTYLTCGQAVSSAHGIKGGPHVVDNYWCGANGNWSYLSPDTAENKTYYLLLYVTTAEMLCRVATEVAVVETKSLNCGKVIPPIKLSLTTNRAITVDHIRIFQY